MKKKHYRTPRGYDGTKLTSHVIHDVLPVILRKIGTVYKERGDLLLAAWPEIIGSKLASMTKAETFDMGILTVSVKNSTLYSLLSRHEKHKLLRSLREKFPNTTIRSIVFRMG